MNCIWRLWKIKKIRTITVDTQAENLSHAFHCEDSASRTMTFEQTCGSIKRLRVARAQYGRGSHVRTWWLKYPLACWGCASWYCSAERVPKTGGLLHIGGNGREFSYNVFERAYFLFSTIWIESSSIKIGSALWSSPLDISNPVRRTESSGKILYSGSHWRGSTMMLMSKLTQKYNHSTRQPLIRSVQCFLYVIIFTFDWF